MRITTLYFASLVVLLFCGLTTGQQDAGAQVLVGDVVVDATAEVAPRAMAYAKALASEARTERVAFMGVVAAPVPAALREHVELKPGVGLVVGSVEKDSPADKAGLKQFDILIKLDDQWLVNPQQFGTLVRMHSPGDEVAVTLIRKGNEQTLKASLIEKEVPVMTWRDDQGNDPFTGTSWPGGLVKFSGAPQIDFDRAFDVNDENVTSIGITDSDHTATLTIQDGQKNLNIKKKDGTVVFDGPVDTPEQRQKLSPELLTKLERLESRPGMIRIKLRPRLAVPTTQP